MLSDIGNRISNPCVKNNRLSLRQFLRIPLTTGSKCVNQVLLITRY